MELAQSILKQFENELYQTNRTAVLRPSHFPKNTIEGLDPKNLNFEKLISIIGDSWFGGNFDSYVETLDAK